MAGKVTFVGAGSGDPRLLTVRAAEVLADADFVLFDSQVHPDILGRLPEGTPRHPIGAAMTAESIASLLSDEAKQGRHAVRIAWGDPLFFGTTDEEGVAVARTGVPIEIVPGIGPFIAVSAFAGVPLTRSSDASPSVAVVNVTAGHESLHDWDKLAKATDTLAILCDVESVAETARSLVFYGRASDERVTLVENVSLPTQRVHEMTLGHVPEAVLKARRVVFVVGERATRKRELAWLEALPLFGKRVLVTRARDQVSGAASLLRERGADPVVISTIEIQPPSDPSAMIDAVPRIASGRYAWVAFTSANGVERLFAEILRQGADARVFGKSKLAAIGPGTKAALERCGLVADLVAKESRGEGLATELLAAFDGSTGAVLLARAEVARDALPDALRAAGSVVDDVAVYRTRAPPRALLEGLAALLEDGEIDAVTFTSASTVDHLCDALESRAASLLAKTCIATIGPVTTAAAKKHGIRVDAEASEYTVPGLIAALEAKFVKSN